MNGKNNLGVHSGTNVFDLYGITETDDISFLPVSGDGESYPVGWYKGSGAISLTNYKNLPTGAIIHDLQAHKDHEKVGASGTDTWVSSAARS